jgi:hypothetical protein
MPINWPFSKTYKLKCPDGTIKTVYRNVDDAFPLFIPGWQASLAGAIKAQNFGSSEIKGEYASKIEGLLFSLDELNQSLMMNFRGAYVAYATDPCCNGSMLNRQVDMILREQHRFQLVRAQIRALVTLAASKGNNHDRIMDAFQRIVDQIGGREVADAASEEVVSSREAMRHLIGETK